MKILITAGPTREYIDDIRFITNASSGKMGVSLAGEALDRGHEVTLIHGPIDVETPTGCQTVNVETTSEMIHEVLEELGSGGYDFLICAAALADYTPIEKKTGKIRSGGELSLKLEPTPKLLEEVRKKHPELEMVGFKAEHDVGDKELEEKAREILDRYGLSLVVGNDVSTGVMGSDETRILLVGKEKTMHSRRMTKEDAAREILDFIGIP